MLLAGGAMAGSGMDLGLLGLMLLMAVGAETAEVAAVEAVVAETIALVVAVVVQGRGVCRGGTCRSNWRATQRCSGGGTHGCHSCQSKWEWWWWWCVLAREHNSCVDSFRVPCVVYNNNNNNEKRGLE